MTPMRWSGNAMPEYYDLSRNKDDGSLRDAGREDEENDAEEGDED